MRMILFAAALLAVTGGIAVAAIPSPDGSVTACVAKSGAVRVIDTSKKGAKCKKGEKKVVWSQRGPAGARGANGAAGAAGERGPAGAQGPIGPMGSTGSTGTVDTSNFFTKSEADARFLGKTATAANSLRLGDVGEEDWIRGGGDIRPQANFVPGGDGGSFFTVSDSGGAGAVGRIEVSCSDPATQATLRWRNTSASFLEAVLVDDGTGTTTSNLSPNGLSPLITLVGGRHIVYSVIYSTDYVVVDLWAVPGIAGGNQCAFAGRVYRR